MKSTGGAACAFAFNRAVNAVGAPPIPCFPRGLGTLCANAAQTDPAAINISRLVIGVTFLRASFYLEIGYTRQRAKNDFLVGAWGGDRRRAGTRRARRARRNTGIPRPRPGAGCGLRQKRRARVCRELCRLSWKDGAGRRGSRPCPVGRGSARRKGRGDRSAAQDRPSGSRNARVPVFIAG